VGVSVERRRVPTVRAEKGFEPLNSDDASCPRWSAPTDPRTKSRISMPGSPRSCQGEWSGPGRAPPAALNDLRSAILHLLGLDHEDEAEAERMEALEQVLLTRFYRARVPEP